MRVIIKDREKTIISYASNKEKRQTLTLFSNVFNVKFNTRKRHDIHINPTVFNIRLIKVSRISLQLNNKINTRRLFIKIIGRLKIIKRRRLNAGLPRILKRND